jgi:hypothetical protein
VRADAQFEAFKAEATMNSGRPFPASSSFLLQTTSEHTEKFDTGISCSSAEYDGFRIGCISSPAADQLEVRE